MSTTSSCGQKEESTTSYIQMAQYILKMEMEANKELRSVRVRETRQSCVRLL